MADTTLILVGIGVLLLCLLITVFLLLVYSGLFRTVEVGAGRPPIADVVIAYKFFRGPYKETGPHFTELAKLAPDNKCLGIFYDDPNTVAPRKLRFVVASILAEGGAPISEEMRKKFTDEGYKIHNLPFVTNVVKTSFPYISLLSIFIAMSKVYPRVAEYVQEHKLCAHPCLEIYDGKDIHFMAPLAKQDEFYVSEYNQPSPEDDASELEDPSLAESLPDDSISYSEPSFSEISQSLSTDLTVSTEDKEGEVIKMAAVQAGAGEAKNLADSGFSSDAVPSPLSGSLQVEDPADTGSEGSSGSPFEDIKGETEELIKEMNQQAESKE
ncbi:testis-expressed protein 264 homolog [Haliotis asinina]|uniref:testis-expressed protein 264 homolog n=1 Tax=Haliotis asinina TaxID=109174 RepID=UPI00353248BC